MMLNEIETPQIEYAKAHFPWVLSSELYTAKELATKLKISVQTIRKRIRDKELKAFLASNKKSYRIPKEEVIRYLYHINMQALAEREDEDL